MGLYRDESGLVFQMDDDFAAARGYSPVAPEEEAAIYQERGLAARADEGFGGAARAGLSRFASGATLGVSDVLLDEVLDPLEREQLQRDIGAHPIVSGVGEVAGMIAPALAAPGSTLAHTPAGYLNAFAAGEVKQGLARGGLGGTARAINAMGAEGAIQSAGQYIGHSALADKEVTAEGLAGALGTGYAFGAAGGGAGLGVVKGTVAARRMYSRWMDGAKASKDAQSAWSLASQEALDADLATASTLQNRYDEIQAAKREALKYRNETKAMVEEERIRAAAAGPVPKEGTSAPKTGIDIDTPIREPKTSVYNRIDIDEPFREPKTSVFKREAAAPAEGATALEEQLAGTKAALDEGKAIKDIAPPATPRKGRNPSDEIEKMLAEKKAADAKPKYDVPKGRMSGDDLVRGMKEIADAKAVKGPMPPEYGPTSRAPFSNLRTELSQKLLPEIRYERTADLLGQPVAKEEARILEALDEIEDARSTMKRVEESLTTDQLKMLRQDNETFVGTPRGKTLERLDALHEDALVNARSLDPEEAGAWLRRADEVEDLMMRLPAEQDVYWDLGDNISVISRYEKAIAKAAEVAGDSAHPSALAMAEAVSKAEKDSIRKTMERTARAVDDGVEYGPTYKTPKERVTYARERALNAQRAVDDLGAQEADIGAALGQANKKARAGQQLKKTMLRAEAKAARAGAGAPEAFGAFEILDLPGLPKPSDLPVVGPLLGAWLKYRTLKAALGRKMGRVSATADARVAVAASRTRDRIARAIDKSLKVTDAGGKAMMRFAPKAAAILSARIYDDGEPAPKKGAPIGELTAARVRELASYVMTPGVIERDVRLQLVGVTDPDLILAAEKHRRAAMEWLLKNAPKAPEQGVMQTLKWQPSPAESMAFARRWEAVDDPAGVYERLASQQEMLSLEAAQALREVYPQLFAQARQHALERIAENKAQVAYRTRIQMSLLYQLPLDAALDPGNLKITQSVYERKPASPAYVPAMNQPPQAAVPQSSVAQPVNISQAYNPEVNRR